MIRINLKKADDFLKIRETLTRIGIANHDKKILWQSCHIIQQKGFYYIAHFKELLRRDGRDVILSSDDMNRRDDIANLLDEWGLCEVVDSINPPLTREFCIISHKDKSNWKLESKYIFQKGE